MLASSSLIGLDWNTEWPFLLNTFTSDKPKKLSRYMIIKPDAVSTVLVAIYLSYVLGCAVQYSLQRWCTNTIVTSSDRTDSI